MLYTCENCGEKHGREFALVCHACEFELESLRVNSNAIDYRETGYGDAGDIFETPEIETESLRDVLADIAGGLRTDSRGFWIPDPPC